MLAGENRFMAVIRRLEGASYQVQYETVPLATVANVERLLPLEYVAPSRNNVKEEFRSYVEPLVGGPLLRHTRLF